MTAEQARLVRDLRSFESPVCMEAAAAIEKMAETILELKEEIAQNERDLQRCAERDHEGSFR